MMTNYRVMNKLVCVNFTKATLYWINEVIPTHKPNNINDIHIFVFNINKVDIQRLIILASACKEKKIKCFVHCFYQDDKEYLKEKCNIVNNKYFLINCESSVMIFSYSNGKYMYVYYREIRIKTQTNKGEKINKITYIYDDSPNEKDICVIEQ